MIKTGKNLKKVSNRALTVNNIDDQHFCLTSNLFFPIKSNAFIYILSNQLIVEKLNKLKEYKIQCFKSEMYKIMKPWKDMNLMLPSEKLLNTLNISYSLFECSNTIENCLICHICRKIVKFNNIKKHKRLCHVNTCKFLHVDGRTCNKEKHTRNLHNGFFEQKLITNINLNIDKKKFRRYFSMEEINNTSSIIAYKTSNILDNLVHIINSFSTQYDIFSKKCLCFVTLKNCQCFRYFLNNIDDKVFKEQKKKTVYESVKQFKCLKRKSICIIVAKKEYGEIKNKLYSFFSTFRKNNFMKLILLHDFTKDALL